MIKLKTRTIKYVDYFEMVEKLEKKYNINTRDFAKRSIFTHESFIKYEKWLNDVHNTSQEKLREKLGPVNKLYSKYRMPDEFKIGEPPYQDFWHWLLEYQLDNFEKGKPILLNWQDCLECAYGIQAEPWVIEIIRLFVTEYGDNDYTVIIDW